MSATQPFNVSEELAKLQHEKKNGQMRRLPPNARVQKRPIIHAPIASPYAGAAVQKVVYVSSKTPFMSAVKRVKKLLLHVEKRATQSVDMIKRGDKEGLKRLADASDKLGKDREEVLVKASGKAMAKAISVGEWFSNKEKDVPCNVEVRSSNVSVVDDIVEVDREESDGEIEAEESTTSLQAGETTMELFGDTSKASDDPIPAQQQAQSTNTDTKPSAEMNSSKRRRRRRKRKRQYDEDDLPEQRLRWVKTVEVAISLKA